VELVHQPYRFWIKQESWGAKTGLSWNYLGGKFMLYLVKAKLTRIPFIKNSATEFVMHVHPNAKDIFGKESFLFKSGPEHQAARRSFIKLFTKKAAPAYLSVKEEMVRNYGSRLKGKLISAATSRI
jgi:cytochrome P450 family 710 subfamily A protein